MATRKILIAYDNSFFSAKAVQWVVDKGFLDSAKDEITLATYVNEEPSQVYDTFTLEAAAMAGGQWLVDEYKYKVGELEKSAEEVLHRASESLKGYNIKTTVLRGRGSIGLELIDFANQKDFDLIILGNRGLGYFKRQLSGSVSDYIVHHSHIPVLVVKTKEEPPKPEAKKHT